MMGQQEKAFKYSTLDDLEDLQEFPFLAEAKTSKLLPLAAFIEEAKWKRPSWTKNDLMQKQEAHNMTCTHFRIQGQGLKKGVNIGASWLE
ncbi:hypothetical protein T265_10879 [Opisthorchis viverrini]|uniref:Uncharacterized protein n=1 Tax=Opisthorchis viverrini TaxID=6198 RepID=A0A074Z4Y7_OPIVI|nr:hypothetical protein T265_10879 [Opisthorchis viverrini]KER20597.1 hypothetical protein T265_10879 [Opisthorchis viverrini]